jgi:Class II flagellar assembly regulator.
LRIDATHRAGGVAGRGAAGKSGGGPAFVPVGAEAGGRVASSAPVMQTAGLEAILALQGVGTATEQRRRAVRRGNRLLDGLEAIKADLLVGQVPSERLDALMVELGALRERVEPGLDGVLDDIELRVRVELAKRGRFPAF